ncbi:nuclease-related domain-containing protein [Salinibacillus xinjiangensis]|uniref:nuclease-related domain-containing protein n=1 Tax=Salinibacillus xinjiangensis TaxID=1229268 RepID=UPI001890D2E3|nr:nuclease-related domain-containing protein [Salinibacillus xinjiangensis]
MIVKQRDIPMKMLKTEALNRRVDDHHRMKSLIEQHYLNFRAGYNGEKAIDFYLRFLNPDTYQILHNVRIPDRNNFFQMDTLILTKHFILIVEVKNYYQEIVYDEMGQAYRNIGGVEEGYSNHVEQVLLQKRRLSDWLLKHRFPQPPIETLVVFTNPKTIIKNLAHDPLITETVIQKEKLLSKIEYFTAKHQIKLLNRNQLNKITANLKDQHTPESVDVLKKYNVSTHELKLGVFCPKCDTNTMYRNHGKWTCANCGGHSKNAHVAALKDYYLLIGDQINNRQARFFLKVNSVHMMKQLLQKEKLKMIGVTSARRYFLDYTNAKDWALSTKE